jgi:hypothetical protein
MPEKQRKRSGMPDNNGKGTECLKNNGKERNA